MLTSEVNSQDGGGLPQKGRGYAIASGILGWTLDAFDFFVVVFLVDTLAKHFVVGKASIVLTIGATLVMRPVGALLFGMLAIPAGGWAAWSLFGRRAGLIAAVLFALNPFITAYGEETRMYTLMALLGLLATAGFVQALPAASRPRVLFARRLRARP